MQLKEFNILLDIKKHSKVDYFEVVQGDSFSNVLNISLVDGLKQYDLTGTNVEIIFSKGDGTTVQQLDPIIMNELQGKIQCTLKTNTIAIPGSVKAEVRVTENETLLTSTNFSFYVRKSLINDETIVSTNEFPILTQLVNQTQGLISTTEGLINQVGQIEGQVPANVVADLNKVQTDLLSHKADFMSHGIDNAGFHNSIFRGKNLGTSVTTKQYADIANGTFEDLYIGDYWTISGINWRIAAFNYYRNTGDTLIPGNHITIVPDTQLYDYGMNPTNITTGGYAGSDMYINGLEQAKTTIRGIFGSHLVKHRQLHSNVTVDGKASGWVWVDSEVDLMSEIMVYGSTVWGESTIGGTGYNIGVGKNQLPLFALNPQSINTRQSYWLRDVVSASFFAFVRGSGYASSYGASYAYGVRPAFSIS